MLPHLKPTPLVAVLSLPLSLRCPLPLPSVDLDRALAASQNSASNAASSTVQSKPSHGGTRASKDSGRMSTQRQSTSASSVASGCDSDSGSCLEYTLNPDSGSDADSVALSVTAEYELRKKKDQERAANSTTVPSLSLNMNQRITSRAAHERMQEALQTRMFFLKNLTRILVLSSTSAQCIKRKCSSLVSVQKYVHFASSLTQQPPCGPHKRPLTGNVRVRLQCRTTIPWSHPWCSVQNTSKEGCRYGASLFFPLCIFCPHSVDVTPPRASGSVSRLGLCVAVGAAPWWECNCEIAGDPKRGPHRVY